MSTKTKKKKNQWDDNQIKKGDDFKYLGSWRLEKMWTTGKHKHVTTLAFQFTLQYQDKALSNNQLILLYGSKTDNFHLNNKDN